MGKTISYAIYNRPDYLEVALEHLLQNDLQDWEILFSIDPSKETDNIVRVIEEKMGKFKNYLIHINEKRLGSQLNTYISLYYVFKCQSDINIYLEDDIIISPDVTRIADWYSKIEKQDIICLNLLYGSCGGLNHKSGAKEHIFYKTNEFNSLGYILTSEQWNSYFKDYWFNHDHGVVDKFGNPVLGWDWAILYHHIKNKGLYTLQPDFARSNHIGRDRGTFCSPEFHDRTFSDIKILSKRETSDSYMIK